MELSQPTPENLKATMTCSEFWTESKAAYKSGMIAEWDSLDMYTRAWVMAIQETLEVMERAAEVVYSQPKDS